MHFFIPQPETDEPPPEVDDVRVIKGWREHLRKQGFPNDGRCFYRLSYRHNSKDWVATVGNLLGDGAPPGVSDPALREPVMAIFRDASRDVYLILTISRGVLRGIPIMVGASGVYSAEEFEGALAKEDTEWI